MLSRTHTRWETAAVCAALGTPHAEQFRCYYPLCPHVLRRGHAGPFRRVHRPPWNPNYGIHHLECVGVVMAPRVM